MANIFFGGFEMGTLNGEFNALAQPVVAMYGGATLVVPGGRSGSFQAKTEGDSNGSFSRGTTFNFPTPLNEFFFQVALCSDYSGPFWSAYWGDVGILRWKKDGNVLGGIKYLVASNTFAVYSDNFITEVGSFVAPPGSIYFVFEIHIVIDAVNGKIEVRKDMNTVVSYTGNTKPTADTTVNIIDISQAPWTRYIYMDDFVLNDPTGTVMNSWPGGLRIACLTPNADIGTNQWAPSTGTSHFEVIDEIPPSGSDYLSTPSSNQVESFGLANLPAGALVVQAVKVLASARKDSDTAPTRLALGLNIGGVDYYGSDQDLATVSQGVANFMTISPATGLPFTVAEVNAMNLLLKSKD